MKLLPWLDTTVHFIILILVILIFLRLNKESFENCVGVQYNGLNLLDNPTDPVCTEGITSRFPDGGCLYYNPEQVAIDYMKGAFTPAV